MTNVESYGLTDLLLSRLTATEVSLVAHLLGIWGPFQPGQAFEPAAQRRPHDAIL